MADDFLRLAAEQQAPQPTAAMRGHDDQRAPFVRGNVKDCFRGSAAENVARLARHLKLRAPNPC